MPIDHRPTSIVGIKRTAKEISKAKGIAHTEALEEAAKRAGFQNFAHARRVLTEGVDRTYPPRWRGAMKVLKHSVIFLCLGLFGVVDIIEGLRTSGAAIDIHQTIPQVSDLKPDTAGDQRESTVQGQTDIQRIMAARRATDPIVAAQIERTLKQSGELAEAGKYKEALAALDKLQAIPDKTVPWARDIDQRRDYLTTMTAKAGHLDSQVR